MIRWTAILIFSLVASVFSLVASVASAQPSTQRARPNFVFVLIDDMGYGDLRCYDPQAAPTPNIDRLAAEGIRFTQFYVNAPICSPSRAAFLTGQYPQRWRITSYIDHRRLNDERGMAQWLDPAAPTVARELQRAGYATGHFGKWHLGGGRNVGDAPLITEYGFDASLTQFEGLGDRLLGLFDKHDGSEPERSGLALDSERLGRGKVEWVDRSQLTGRFADRAIEFMDQAQRDGKPFYVNVWPDDVHSPFFPPERTREGKRALYRAVVRAADEQLGRLFDHIRNDPSLRANTIVILASDNGPEPGAGSAGPFRGAKTNLYEGGIREPFIVWAPGRMDPRGVESVNERSVIAGIDLAPTLLSLAGIAAAPELSFDGVDRSRTLMGEEQAIRSTPLFWRRPPDRPGTIDNPFPDLAMREGNWKLLCAADGTSPQLYDLSTDIAEGRNLASAQADRVRSMTAALLAWNADLPVDRPEMPRAAN